MKFLLSGFISLLALGISGPENDERLSILQNQLQESEQYILQILAGVESAHWMKKNDPDRWSIAECAEHILTAERAILQSIRQKINEESPVDKAEPVTDEHVLNVLYDRVSKRVRTQEPFEPKGALVSKEAFILAFKESRQEISAFLDQNRADLHKYFTQSPAGEVSLHQMLLVLSGHTARHTNQIEEVKHELGLSTATIAFGGNVKVNVHTSKREEIKRLFGEILLLDIDEQKNYDRVMFDGGGFVAFVYHEDEARLLPVEAFANSMQAGLRTTPAFFESVKRRIMASGARIYTPEYDVNPAEDFYFHAPGGQVFRLVKVNAESL